MPNPTPATPAITPEHVNAMRAIQHVVGRANAAKGFHAEGDALRTARYGDGSDEVHEYGQADVRNLRMYYSEKLFLIASEPNEGLDELRAGREVDETYYPTWRKAVDAAGGNYEAVPFELGKFKPEGVPSELADTVIRTFDLADEAGIDLAAMIAEKLAYNANRPKMHGKQF